MSLNGLDAAPVSEAYYAAIVEVGGWFLLKYTSRDSVELLGRGKGGVHEARNELLRYEEKSPLYGLIIYRRRKVLIKYIPNGTSRLLQVRTAVHFQAVAERYAPYETILEISHPDELSDTSLASSFPLHTASPAVSTVRLDEISEDAEDGGAGALFPKAPARTKSSTSAKFGTARYKTERRVDQLMRSQQLKRSISNESASSLSTSPSGGLKPSLSQFLVHDESGTRSITSLSPSVASVTEYAGSSAGSDASTTKETETEVAAETEITPSTIEPHDLLDLQDQSSERESEVTPSALVETPSIREPSPERPSESTERPTSTFDQEQPPHMPALSEQKSLPDQRTLGEEEPFDFSYLEPKPKIKLGPRPVASPERSHKSGALGTSLLPAGYRPAKKQEQQRPKSTGPVSSNVLAGLGLLPVPPPIPDVPEYNPRPVSRGSVKSMPSQKSTTMTPEKLRLMKAVELRKKQMRKSNPHVRTPVPAEQVPEVPQVSQNVLAGESSQASLQPASELAQSRKLDSGIEMENQDQMVDERQADGTPSGNHSVERGAPLGPPLGLLSESVFDEQTEPQQEISLQPEEINTRSTKEVADIQQHAGAENSPILSHNLSGRDVSPSPAPIPASSVQDHQVAPSTEGFPTPPTGVPSTVDRSIDETTFSTSLENLITDVPAIVTTASSRPQTAEDPGELPKDRSPSPLENSGYSSMASSGNLATPSDEAIRQMSDLAKRRRGLVEPLHIEVETRRNSDADSLTDNDLLEELQSATFHDAKEMVVSKSPGPSTPFFPPQAGRTSSFTSAGSQPRSPVKEISIPNGVSQTTAAVSPDEPLQQRAEDDRSVSPEFVQQPTSRQSSFSVSPVDYANPGPSLKRNVSSGITQRIKALNELSNREPSAVPVHIPTRALSPDPAPVFLNERSRPSMRSPHSRTGSSYRVRSSVDRAGSFPNGAQHAEIPHTWNTSHDVTSNRDSVSVKARIVRVPTAGSTERPAEYSTDLHESQLEINHSRGIPTPTPVSQAFLPPMPAEPLNNPPSPDHRSLHSLRRKSLGRSKASTPGPTPANDDNRSINASFMSIDEPTTSRTSRFFKRMSTFGSSSKRRSVATSPAASGVTSPVPTESPAPRAASVATNHTATDRETPPAVQVGDLNVQFPDTLLWKRRWLSLDDAGYLHLSPPGASRGGKKFHLSEFRAPYAPDLDRQELPHSVCLEFAAGKFDGNEEGVMQVACEDAMGQRQVLRLLGGYWKSWVG